MSDTAVVVLFYASATHGVSIAELPVPYGVCLGCSIVPLAIGFYLRRRSE
jgi:hypothetical protein